MAATFSTANVAGTADTGATTEASASTVVPSSSIVYVLVENSDGSPLAPTGVVWDAAGVNQALTQIGTTITHGTYYRGSLWRGIGLTAKTAVFTASWSANQGERLVSPCVYTGLDSGTPNGTVTQNSGGATSTVTTGAITTTVGQMLLMMAGRGNAGSATTWDTPTGTERAEGSTSGTPFDSAASQDFVATGTSTTLTWTLSNTPDGWAVFAIPLNDAGAGPSSPFPPWPQRLFQRAA